MKLPKRKKCKTCGRTLAIKNFLRKSKNRKWHSSECSSCVSKKKKEIYIQVNNEPTFVDKPLEWHYGYVKTHAKFRGTGRKAIPFKLEYKDLLETFPDDKKCFLSGRDINLTSKQITASSQTASLDRIDSSKPYEKGNIQWVHKFIQNAKQTLPQDEFIQLCRDVYWTHPGPHSRDLLTLK